MCLLSCMSCRRPLVPLGPSLALLDVGSSMAASCPGRSLKRLSRSEQCGKLLVSGEALRAERSSRHHLAGLGSLCPLPESAQGLSTKCPTGQSQLASHASPDYGTGGNTRALFQLAGRLGPKNPKRSLQLRGEIWTHDQQITCLKDFYSDLYTTQVANPHSDLDGVDMPTPSTTPDFRDQTGPVETPPALPFKIRCLDLTQLEKALTSLPPHKAAPAHLAPSSAWVACAQVLTPWLTLRPFVTTFLRGVPQYA